MAEEGLALQVEGLCRRYRLDGRDIEVFRGAEFAIEAGQTAAVVGASGAGKSTLLHLLGLLDRPSAGTVRYDGEIVLQRSEAVIEDFRNRQVGFVFQFHHLLPEFTELENVMMPAIIAGKSMTEARNNASTLLDQVGLSARMTHAPGELSGGEQQRVALARALVMEPRLLLADEPTGNLDPETGAKVLELLLELNEARGTTLIVATHNMSLADRLPSCLHIAGGLVRYRGEAA